MIHRLFRSSNTVAALFCLSTSSAFALYSFNHIKNPRERLVYTMGLGSSTISTDMSSPPLSLVETIITDKSQLSGSPLTLSYRRYEVFLTASRVFADYKLVQWRCDQIDDSEEGEIRKELLWDQAHERNAQFLCSKFISLAALWIKLGQYLSSRADIMPEPYLRVLAKCQDALPPRPFNEIKSLIESELGKPLHHIFQRVEEIPLAVASIASVHRATLLNGQEVVIKVQHENVGQKLIQDLQNLETIGNTVRYLDRDFDMSPVIREWAKEVPKELDFRKEAENMQRVERNLAPLFQYNVHHDNNMNVYNKNDMSIDVTFAKVIPGLVTEKILVMSYIDGFKIDNKEYLNKYGIDRSNIMKHITRSYAHQIFVDGFFSGDPHPGNILVDAHARLPVLLDFGLTKEVSPDIRFQFAKLIVAADEQDIYGLLQALDGLGLKLRTDVPFDINLLAKYFFRDAKPQAEAQIESKQRREEFKKKEEIKLKSLYVGDKVDVSTRNWIGWRKVKKGEIIQVKDSGSYSSNNTNNNDDNKTTNSNNHHHVEDAKYDILTIRTTNGKEILSQRSHVKLQKSRSPIDAWPDAFIFFERVLGLLRGLTASLDVSQSYLEVMTPFARLALMRYSHHKQQRQQELIQQRNIYDNNETTLSCSVNDSYSTLASSPTISMSDFDKELLLTSSSSSSSSLTATTAATASVKGHDSLSDGVTVAGDINHTHGIRELLQELIASGDILGCQVVVIKDDEVVVDLYGGVRDPYECTAVESDTLFNCFSVTKGISASVIHLLAEKGIIDLKAPVSQYWPEFGVNGKEKITITHVLNHQSGLSNAGLDELSSDPFLCCDTSFMINIMANATADAPAGSTTKYHYLSFGWILDGIVQKVTGMEIKDCVRLNVALPLGIDQQLMIGTSSLSSSSLNETWNDTIEEGDVGAGHESMNKASSSSSSSNLATLVMKRQDANSNVTLQQLRPKPTTEETEALGVSDSSSDNSSTLRSQSASTPFKTSQEPAQIGTATTSSQETTATTTKTTTTTTTSMNATTNTSMNTNTTAKSTSAKRPTGTPSMLLNPTFFNSPRIRDASIPAANGHFSARGLATFYNSLLPKSTKQSIRLFESTQGLNLLNTSNNGSSGSSLSSTEGEVLLQGGAAVGSDAGKFRMGFQIYPTTTTPTTATENSEDVVAFGHSGVGGSIAFCDPTNGSNLAVAITLNRLSMNSVATKNIIQKIYKCCNRPVPKAFAN